MNHQRLDIATLVADGEDVPLLYADVVIVDRESGQSDWECVAASRVDVALEQAPYGLELMTVEGRRLRGDAIVVRSDGRGHVFRGVGPLSEV